MDPFPKPENDLFSQNQTKKFPQTKVSPEIDTKSRIREMVKMKLANLNDVILVDLVPYQQTQRGLQFCTCQSVSLAN